MKARLWKEFMAVRFYAICLAALSPFGLAARRLMADDGTVAIWGSLTISAFLFLLTSVNAFGSEFGAGTVGWLLAQPVSRRRIWAEKFAIGTVTILIGAALNGWVFRPWFTHADLSGRVVVDPGADAYSIITACNGALALAGGPLAAVVCRDAFKGLLMALIMPAALALTAQVAVALFLPAAASVRFFEFANQQLGPAAPLILLTAVWAPLGIWLGWIAFKRLEV